MPPESPQVSSEFPPGELLIFIGHSDDASTEADAIKLLESKIEQEFRLLLKPVRDRSPFQRSRVWKWREDALSLTGGQDAVVREALDHARIAIFVFKERVGEVTWQELEQVRERSREQRLHVLAFFPAKLPETVNSADEQVIDNWKALLRHQKELTLDWNDPNGVAVTPCPTYASIDDLTAAVLEKLKIAMADILAVESSEARPKPLPQVDASAALFQRYQATLQQQLGDMTLMGSPAFGHVPLKLSETFVSLSLSGSSLCEKRVESQGYQCDELAYERSSSPERVMQLVFVEQFCSLLLIIGEPGSGKTTLLKHYALSCLDEQQREKYGFTEPVKVFFLPLRELKKRGKSYTSLEDNLAAWSARQLLTIKKEYLTQWLEQPSVLVLLDGLDEISNVKDRIAACKWITRTVQRFTRAKFVVTSRSTGYRKGDGIEIEAGHRRADILDFSLEQKSEFLRRWFKAALLAEIRPDKADKAEWQQQQEQKAAQEVTAVLAFLADEKNNSLRLLAGMPLLLQIMAMLWKERGYLAEGRIELYDAALNFMLEYRDRYRAIPPLLAAKDARRVLSPVSLWMQEELQKDEIDRQEMQQQMQVQLDTLSNALLASDVCQNLVDRAGLLLEYGDHLYVFRHKSFREYLAGVQLVKTIHKPGCLETLVSHFGDDWWTEVFRYFIALLDDADLFNSFIKKLFDSPVTENLTQKQQDLLITLIDEAPQCKIDVLKNKLLDSATTLERQRYLVECLKAFRKPDADEVLRDFQQSGLSKEKTAVTDILRDPLGAEYILIKGGTFISSMWQMRKTTPDRYFAKYIVTNQQYHRFIRYLERKELDFAERVLVTTYEERLRGMAKNIKGFTDYLDQEQSLAERFRSTYDDDRKFGGDEQPVVGVSWYAARAYCLWLSLLASNGEKNDLYRLPTEEKWDWAAGGQRNKPDEVLEFHRYPWGNEEPTLQHANYNNNEGQTTPVGRYLKGITQEGLFDMAGNVREWMGNKYDESTFTRSLRGGSWSDASANLRCSARGVSADPRCRNDVIGFRVVRSSHSS